MSKLLDDDQSIDGDENHREPMIFERSLHHLTRIRRMFVIKGEHFLTYHDSVGGQTWPESAGLLSSSGLQMPRPGLLSTCV